MEAKVLTGLGEKNSNNGTQWQMQNRVYDSDLVAITICTTANPFYFIRGGNKLDKMEKNLRIRKLIPNECGSLMGVKFEDKVNMSQGKSDSILYHLYGDSIITTVLMCAIGKLLGIDYESKVQEVINDITEKKG